MLSCSKAVSGCCDLVCWQICPGALLLVSVLRNRSTKQVVASQAMVGIRFCTLQLVRPYAFQRLSFEMVVWQKHSSRRALTKALAMAALLCWNLQPFSCQG